MNRGTATFLSALVERRGCNKSRPRRDYEHMRSTELSSFLPWYRSPIAMTGIGVACVALWVLATQVSISDPVLPSVDDPQAAQLIEEESRPVVLEFVVPGCHFCKGASRLLRGVAAQTGDDVRYAQLDLSEHQGLVDRFGVRGVPTILVFHHRQLLGRTAMLESKAALDQMLRPKSSAQVEALPGQQPHQCAFAGVAQAEEIVDRLVVPVRGELERDTPIRSTAWSPCL